MIHLKKILLLTFVLAKNIICSQGFAQGLYKNTDDFLKGNTFFSEPQARIRLHDLFKKKTVVVKYKDSTYTFLKSNLYGYKDKGGNKYRFFKDEIFSILNPGEKITLYKTSTGTGLKNSPIVETYFFSKDAGAEIMPLTLVNLQHSFYDNKAFTKLIEICFVHDSELLEYDNIHNLYRINRLLEIAAHEKH